MEIITEHKNACSLNTGFVGYEIKHKRIQANTTVHITLLKERAIYLLFLANTYKHGIFYVVQTGNVAMGSITSVTPLMADSYFQLKNFGTTSIDVVAGNVDGYISVILIEYN